MDGDFIKSSTTKKLDVLFYDNVISEISGWSTLSGFDWKAKPDKGLHTRTIICYKDESDPSSFVYIVRIASKGYCLTCH